MEPREQRLQLDKAGVFEKIFNEFYPSLHMFACSFVDQDAATDIVQESFVVCWEYRRRFDSRTKLSSFLYTVVRNRCLNSLRTQKKRVGEMPVIESDDFFVDRMIEEEAYRLFYAAVEALPNRTREVIYCSLRGMKNSEIADFLGISENSVHTLKKLAYKKLKVSLENTAGLAVLMCFLGM